MAFGGSDKGSCLVRIMTYKKVYCIKCKKTTNHVFKNYVADPYTYKKCMKCKTLSLSNIQIKERKDNV